jgi:hypothetical protein
MVALVAAATASAHHLDPQHEITAADQSRAQAIVVRRSDLGRRWIVAQSGNVGHLTCKGYDQSDLTVTGEVGPKAWFSPQLQFVLTQARVYESVGDANTAWRRGTSVAGRKCVATEFARLSTPTGGHLVSLRRIPFPRVAPRVAAFRIVFRVGAQSAPVTADVIALQRSRAQSLFTVIAVVGRPSVDSVRLARVLATRMTAAMRGG